MKPMKSRGTVEPLYAKRCVWLSGHTPSLTPDEARDLARRLIAAADEVELPESARQMADDR